MQFFNLVQKKPFSKVKKNAKNQEKIQARKFGKSLGTFLANACGLRGGKEARNDKSSNR